MKKIIKIEISYHDCDRLNITQADLMVIQNEVLNQLCIVEDTAEGRFGIDAKTIEPINEEELDSLAESCCIADEGELYSTYLDGFKAGYIKAKEQ